MRPSLESWTYSPRRKADKVLVKRSLLLLFASLAVGLVPAFAQKGQSQVVFIDPKLQKVVPVYKLDGEGRPSSEPITKLIPGDLMTLKEIRKDGWYVIQGKDIAGNSIDLAVDPKTVTVNGQTAIFRAAEYSRTLKVTGAGASWGVNAPGLDTEICTIDPGHCSEMLPKDGFVVQEAALVETTEGSSKIRWKNYYRTADNWWLDAENAEKVDGSWSGLEDYSVSDDVCTQDDPTAPFDFDTRRGIEDAAKELLEISNEQQLAKILPHVGDCHSMDIPNYHGHLISSMAKKNLPSLVKETRGEKGTVEIAPATKADWVSIDLLARTLYGEMASCFGKGKQYPKSVAKVILNRVDFAAKQPRLGARFLEASKRNENRNDITNVVFKDKQFSVWNRDDAARRMAMCPPSSSDKKFWKGSLPSELEQDIWKQAVKIASEAVLQGQSFRKKTSDLKALYYTSNFELSEKHYTPITNARIAGQPVPLSRCLQLWSAKDLKKISPEFGWWQELLKMVAAR